MIRDRDTNFVYFSELLQEKYPAFTEHFLQKLETQGVKYSFLKETKDVWAVDYMPVQFERNKFIQFVYGPDYLNDKRWNRLRTVPSLLYEQLNILPKQSELIVDGGNIVKGENVVIVTDKVFKENKSISPEQVKSILQEELEVEKVIFIPKEPFDYIGHSDGMVRIINERQVILNDYPDSTTYKRFKAAILRVFEKEEIVVTFLPYTAHVNKSEDDASGCYINYLEMKDCIFVPVFNQKEDESALRVIGDCFKEGNIIQVKSNQLAVDGGVLNCISWNIYRE